MGMKKLILSALALFLLIMGSVGTLACTKETNSFDNIPISIESSWITNSEGFLCLRLDITNNGNKTIRDIQGTFRFTDYGYNDTVINDSGFGHTGHTLYLYDGDGRDIYNKPKTQIKPSETLSLVIHKMMQRDISYVYVVQGYITWIDLVSADNWGMKDIKVYETDFKWLNSRFR